MRYLVPLYKFNKEEKLLGKIVVEKTSLGIFEIVSGQKIRVSTEFVEVNDKNCYSYVKSKDFNGTNLVVPKGTVKDVNKRRIYDHKKYVKEHKKVKAILK